MREQPLREGLPLDAASLLACVATIAEVEVGELPDDPSGVSRWLGGLGLGLAPVAAPREFSWPGPWIARVVPPGGDTRHVVMYGSPPGLVWDPAGGPFELDWIDEGRLVATLDPVLATAAAPLRTEGTLEAIWVAAAAGKPMASPPSVRALAGRGLDGDRYLLGAGTFDSGKPGTAVTLIEAEVCDSFEPPLAAGEHRRNLVTRGIDLNALVGREFAVGGVRCRGMRLCEPCRVAQQYSERPLLRPLVHRGGLRADILSDGELRVGDAVRAL